ncbi:TolC family protein [Limnoglobus roseus]|uniref:TolC family protein n=1 Tax=Limnoglobus roseus TaxID=2598579 RepID=A0A5C1AN89_9BACT|nr:TolC family protein [Limnoglobus roseus]QEL19607.1 TolC family protein [Limnoglobus roseus]
MRILLLGVTVLFAAGCQTTPTAEPLSAFQARYVRKPAATTAVVQAKYETPASTPPVLAADGVPLRESPIDLGTALRLAGVENPTINLAREQIRQALADQLAADALRLPHLNAGVNVRVHRGTLQGGTGVIRNLNSQSVYVGGGVGALASGTVSVPGVQLFVHLGDAVYEPLAAAQRVFGSQSTAHAVQNAVLRDVATTYLELVAAEARLDVLTRATADVGDVARLTAVYAQKGQGRAGDANRAAANAELLRRRVGQAEEDVGVASARLCRLLNLDPTVRLHTPADTLAVPVRFVSEESLLDELLKRAIEARPEVYARTADIAAARTRVKQEKTRPWLPTVAVGFSGGGFGGGSNQVSPEFGPLQARTDFDVAAIWSVENFGLGTRARVRQANAVLGATVATFNTAVNDIRQEVAAALADAQAAARQIDTAKGAVATAEEGFSLDRERITQGQGRPLEVLDSFNLLLDARQELIRAVAAFDAAQFRLLAAVGETPRQN